jgi:AcrR family transcriptional regulator
MPKWFSEPEKELIQKRLLEQGYRLFSTYGLNKTNVEEIAKAVGISKGAFYRFYASKEALFMDVTEQVEIDMRRQVLAVIDQPGPSPRARLYAALKKAFDIFESAPILRLFTSADFDLLFSRVPAEKVQQHLMDDRLFLDELVAHCQAAGIPIRVPAEQIVGLLYPIVIAELNGAAFGQGGFRGSIDALLELIAAYCLGEVELSLQNLSKPIQEKTNEPAD